MYSVTRFVNETASLHFKQTSPDGVTSKIACNLFDSKDELLKIIEQTEYCHCRQLTI